MNTIDFIEAAVRDRRTAVKICGVTTEGDARGLMEMGADAIGLNFWPKSKRFFGDAAAKPWLGELAGSVVRVGVFVNAPESEVMRLHRDGWIDAAQLHGDELPDYCLRIREAGIPFLKAIGLKDAGSLAGLESCGTQTILLDAYAPGEYGGTGRSIDWNLAASVVRESPGVRVMLSGGLTPENVAEAVRIVRPVGVDVAGGVEGAQPGRKDLERAKAFIEAARRGGS